MGRCKKSERKREREWGWSSPFFRPQRAKGVGKKKKKKKEEIQGREENDDGDGGVVVVVLCAMLRGYSSFEVIP